MRKTTLFKKYIQDEEILIMPGAHDALCAKIAQSVGHKAVTVGGYSSSASLLGQPDISLLTLTEMTDCYRRIADSIDIPLFADGDTGHGGLLNVRRTVKEIEKTGVAGMFIEDQVFPKRCGHMLGKQVIPSEEMEAKLRAAVDARQDDDFIIMARTDALAVEGLEYAIERGNLYREAGADIIFVEAPGTFEEMQAITTQVKAPTMANNIEGGRSPLLSAKELQDIGYSVVVFPVAATYAIAQIISELMKEIKETGSTQNFVQKMIPFEDFNRLIGLDILRDLEKSYL